MSKQMREHIDNFKNVTKLKEKKIIVNKINNSINIRWIDETKKTKEVGVFDFIIKNDDCIIVGYRKHDKTINGYDFIKKSIDYVLGLGYKVVSIGKRSDSAINVWKKLENEYVVETEIPKSGSSEKDNIKRIISKKVEE